MKKKESIQYFYSIENIADDGDTAYQAIIPAFNNALVFGGDLEELEEGVRVTIEYAIEQLQKQDKPIPPPDLENKFSGKFMLRIDRGLHATLAAIARANKQSLNSYIHEQLKKIVS